MDKYLKRLEQRIQRPEDVLDAKDIFVELANDREALAQAMLKVLHDLQEFDHYPRETVANQIVFSPLPNIRGLYDVALSYHRKTPASIVTNCFYGLVCTLNTAMQVEHYKLPANWAPDVFSSSTRLQRLDDVTYEPRQVFKLTPGLDAYRFKIQGCALVLKITSRAVLPFEWSFDEETLEAWQSISTSHRETNLIHACRGAAALDDLRFVQPLLSLLGHERHNVRWEALKAVSRLDRNAAWGGLTKLVDDTHPHVARAAKRAIASVGGEKGR
jgi:HEAT repeats